jgi:predicted DNA-binding transcriptional regulator AlpA
MNNDQWTIADIAEFLHVSYRHAREGYIKQPSFPKPVVNVSPRCRAWSAEEVRQWASKPRLQPRSDLSSRRAVVDVEQQGQVAVS